jgi:hypothetical protein
MRARLALQVLAQCEAVHRAVGAEIDIDEHRVVALLRQRRQGTLAVRCSLGAQAQRLQLALQEAQRDLAVIDKQRQRR